MSAASPEATPLRLTVAWFETAFPSGPAIGDPETIAWADFATIFNCRREGPKDGTCFVPSRFTLEPDGRHVRRLKRNVVARSAVALDCDANKQTGELPPPLDAVTARIRGTGWAAVVYTTHSHTEAAPRYRLILPLSEAIAPELPAPEVIADLLRLDGVLDRSKVTPASLFYLPSCENDLDEHRTEIIEGAPIDAAWIRETAGAVLAARQAEADRIAAAANAEAARRREAKIAAGFDPEESLIEKIRPHLDLDAVLRSHGYDRAGAKYRHPNSTSGCYGADIKTLGGVPRVFSHNASDPLHADNMPAWCCGVTALDAFDVATILDFGGDRRKALVALAERFQLGNHAANKAVARVVFRLVRRQAPQQEIEAAALAEGERQGLTREEIWRVARWVSAQCKEAA